MSAGTMNAVYYHAPRQFTLEQVPIPQVADNEVLLKVLCCGICGTDGHVHEGAFIAQFPLIPGHEVVGIVSDLGKGVTGFTRGDRCVADPGVTCGHCFFCRRGKSVLCENFKGRGVNLSGGFSEYVIFESKNVYKIHNLTDEEATLVEPASCAIHGMDKLNAPVGIEALVIGAGPTGLILAQLLKLNGATRVVIAANKGIKTEVAKQLDAGHGLKKDNPYGFDVVVEATGSAKIANDAIDYVRRGGTLMIYGVYDHDALVRWSPSKIFIDEIKDEYLIFFFLWLILTTHCFPRAVAYLDSGKIRVKGMVTDVYKISDYQKALDKMNSRGALKIAVKP
ncbi:D-arabinitol dehydrogenase 1 [Grifola frondosa]|uniref:D-arabinitol dehydrogenase 1 n=1 Tax=Grifola frondosa TaxID=5627 RepID=A0A1C7MJU9_GRIFR|nr:D-arabinitol dehydrogenase 1 [Grifola frondosa]